MKSRTWTVLFSPLFHDPQFFMDYTSLGIVDSGYDDVVTLSWSRKTA